ncbi:UNVERIFIED_CONTAM: hypothetical protein Scaly_1470200 [Sesamum calycinum]|uniref:Uncharacterized protein n=1 Tax=Sesamum calycinum TaxID=2727403 RepID=A0AAW2PNW7_9LAMI
MRQIEVSVKSRNEARELVEQRNYEIAIEVSQLEATISGLREEVAKKSEEIESLKRSIDEKDGKLAEFERESSEKQEGMERELSRLRLLVSDYESKTETQKPLLIDQLNYVSRVHGEMCKVMKIVDAKKSSELSESLFLAQETNMEENIKAALAGMESVHELSKIVVEKTRDLVEERTREVKSLNETIDQLMKEKEQIGSLLRSTLSRRMSVDLSSKTNELFKVAENGLKEAGIEYKFSKFQGSKGKMSPDEVEENEVYALASALENIIKQSQLEIIELKHSVEELRAESNLYKERVDAQTKELNQWKQRVEELEEKERVANENVEGLMMDIAAAEEEITRWKVAAQQEADAGKAVEKDYMTQKEYCCSKFDWFLLYLCIHKAQSFYEFWLYQYPVKLPVAQTAQLCDLLLLASVRQELEEARQAVIESEKKLKFKEETAEAAMAARDAAEKSLRLADMRASRLRDRVEELTRQLDELDTRETSRTGLRRLRYVCWPWQWLGLDYVGSRRPEIPQQNANEMELSEPLL